MSSPPPEPDGVQDPSFHAVQIPSLAMEEAETDTCPPGLDTLLQHSERFWRAEEANATRLATRANLVLTGIAAVIGLKLFAMTREVATVVDAAPGSRPTLFWITAGISGFLLLYAFVKALGIRRWEITFGKPLDSERRAPTASEGLSLPPSIEADPESVSAYEAKDWCFHLTYDAATDLQQRNSERKSDVDSAQRKLFWGIIWLVLSMALFVWIDYSERQRGVEHGTHHNVGPRPERCECQSDTARTHIERARLRELGASSRSRPAAKAGSRECETSASRHSEDK